MKITRLILIALSILVAFNQCSSNDEDFTFVPKVQGENIEEGTIQLTFVANKNNPTLELLLTSDIESNIKIDWGDEFNPRYQYYKLKDGSVSHDYGSNIGEHVVTIKCPDLVNFTVPEGVTSNIKAIYFGDLPKIRGYALLGAENNILEALDITKCPNFWGGNITLYINKENFDFGGIKKCGDLMVGVYVPTKVDLASSDIGVIYLSSSDASSIQIDISNCDKLKMVELAYFGNMSTTDLVYVSEFNTSNSPIESLKIYGFRTNIIDLSSNDQLKEVLFHDLLINKELKLSASVEIIVFETPSFRHIESSISIPYITKLDLSRLTNLNILNIKSVGSLEEIKWGEKHDNLTQVDLWYNQKLKELHLSGYPNLTRVTVLGNNRNLSSVKFSNLPKLASLTVSEARSLTKIEMKDQYPFYSLDLHDNNLSEENLKYIVSNLKDEIISEGGYKNRIELFGNPGYTEEVQTMLSKLKSWEIKEAKSIPASTDSKVQTSEPASNDFTIRGYAPQK